MQLQKEFKQKVFAALVSKRETFGGTDSAFSRQYGMSASVFSRIKKGETDGLLRDSQILNIGRELGVALNERRWNIARTDVFNMIEEDVLFCKTNAKGRICVDDCGIGKTFTAKYLSRTLPNCFYLDASQAKTKYQFSRLLAKTIGVDLNDTYANVKENVKYYLSTLKEPIIIIDEAGDLDYSAFLDIKEYWNGTEGVCGWYLMGADGLRLKIEKGIRNRKVGYREMFSRLSENYTKCVPTAREDRLAFYRKLITDVLSVNMEDRTHLRAIVSRCLVADESGNLGGLRRAESLLILKTPAYV